jgi:hypothetical protein|nr:MAG TPA: Ail/Lom protein [Caudoviricetes sp.]
MKRLLLCLLMLVSGLALAQSVQRPQNIDWIYLATNQTNGYKIYRWKTVIVVDAGAKTGRFAFVDPKLITELHSTASNAQEKSFAHYAIVPAKDITEFERNFGFYRIFNINCETDVISDNDNEQAKPVALNQATQLHQTAANLACVALDVNAEGDRDGTE